MCDRLWLAPEPNRTPKVEKNPQMNKCQMPSNKKAKYVLLLFVHILYIPFRNVLTELGMGVARVQILFGVCFLQVAKHNDLLAMNGSTYPKKQVIRKAVQGESSVACIIFFPTSFECVSLHGFAISQLNSQSQSFSRAVHDHQL